MNTETISPRLSDLLLSGLLCSLLVANPMTAQAEQVTHSYDNLNRLIKSDYGNGNIIEYSYDAAGNRTSQTVRVSNKTPIANAGNNQTVRQNSLVTLNGSTSNDPDSSPSPLSYAWSKTAGANISLIDATKAKPKFTPTVSGLYTFSLVVNDGLANSSPASVNITVPTLGDIDLDGDVDNNDLSKITAVLNKPASGPKDLRDINGDLKLDALDTRKLVLLCTRPRCATQ